MAGRAIPRPRMPDDLLEPRLIRMPDLAPGQWLNTEHPLSREQMRGNVILLDFWDYTCVNCLRTLPYVVVWHRRYASFGLVVVGIHAPEFGFARHHAHVARAIAEYEIGYPVLLDNEYQTWDRFAVKAWPTKVLIDRDGYIRRQWRGEGAYGEMERAIQALLRPRDPEQPLPEPLAPLRPEDQPGAVCFRPTPEIHAGVCGGGLFGGGLGNPEGYATQGPVFYAMPPAEERIEGHIYLAGAWRAWPESVAFAGKTRGEVRVRYSGATANAVLSPSADPVDTILDLRPTAAEPVVEVRQDGRYLTPDRAGADVVVVEDGRSLLRLGQPGMVELVRNPDFETHELALTFCATGQALYSLAFTGCVASQSLHGRETYTAR